MALSRFYPSIDLQFYRLNRSCCLILFPFWQLLLKASIRFSTHLFSVNLFFFILCVSSIFWENVQPGQMHHHTIRLSDCLQVVHNFDVMLFWFYYSVSCFAAPFARAHFGDPTWQHSWRTAAQPFTQTLSLWSTWTAVMYSEVCMMKSHVPLRKYAKISLFLAIWYFMLQTISNKESSCQSFYLVVDFCVY